ncbi:hypothetical protein PpBr36_08490 [Pyricularia pennisetigena]|uniref:hypothetical protein n=1 Tax=Pyricularia pennisetigena TaxID=1578925 RepID=UPI001154AEEF|nr:hypothetical protein PpBr36_08490 [Pyricularia pennisetigena]TLS24357.1 hypothetical protein PpBr36_08490 [Pyricularia pennisetigena]
MAWGLSSWLGLTRCVQIVASLVASALHGFLFGYLSINRLGMANNVIVLQFMVCERRSTKLSVRRWSKFDAWGVLMSLASHIEQRPQPCPLIFMTAWFAFVVIAFSIVHTKGRSTKTTWLVANIVGDVCFIWMGLAMITLLSHAGVPAHCAGLTKSTYADDDTRREPAKGYTSIRFTNQWNGAKGELDRYCALERIFYGATLLLINLQIITVILSILRICQGTYIKKTEASAQTSEQILQLLRDEEKTRPKAYPQNSLASGSGDNGVVQHHQGYSQCDIASIHPMPSEGALSSRTSVLNSRVHPQHHHQCQHHTHHHHQQQPLLSPVSPTTPAFFANRSGPSSPMASPGANESNTTAFNEFETPEDEAAAAALITDGSSGGRADLESGYGSSSALPPYTPGRLNPMNGHGNESNEMRLSGYVKGETRAQNMKDGM